MTYREKGIAGFYRGGTALMLRQGSNWASRQGITDIIRNMMNTVMNNFGMDVRYCNKLFNQYARWFLEFKKFIEKYNLPEEYFKEYYYAAFSGLFILIFGKIKNFKLFDIIIRLWIIVDNLFDSKEEDFGGNRAYIWKKDIYDFFVGGCFENREKRLEFLKKNCDGPIMECIKNIEEMKIAEKKKNGLYLRFYKLFQFSYGGEGEGEGEGEDKGAGTASSFFGNGFPKLPERFLHGHLAKLAEELVRDIRPEDLGLTPQMLQQLEESPSRALELMMEVFSRNPQVLQNTFQRIGRQLQQKVASGQIKANEIAREAEELMKEFAENTDFVAMMEGLKSAFGMEDMEIARKAGKEGSARMAAVKARLQKKKEAKDAALAAAAAAAASPGSAYPGQNVVSVPSIDDLVHQIESTGNRNNSKNSKKVNSGKTKK